MKVIFKKLICFLFIAFWANNSFAGEQINIVASFSIIADITRAIGGERVNVKEMVGPNQDSHNFDPTPQDIHNMLVSDILVINGLGFDRWAQNVVGNNQYSGVLVTAANGVKTIDARDHDHHNHEDITGDFRGQQDPHIWQDPNNGVIIAQNIAKALIAFDKQGKNYYESRLKAYIAELKKIDEKGKKYIKKGRIYLVPHNSFSYLANAYEIKFMAPVGISNDENISAKELSEYIDDARTNKFDGIFKDNLEDNRIIEQIAKESGKKIAGSIYSDALSDKTKPSSTYLDFLRYNIDLIINME